MLKIAINPFGVSEDGAQNIHLLDEDGSSVAIITRHPVWSYLEEQRMARAKLFVNAERMLEILKELQKLEESFETCYDDPDFFIDLVKSIIGKSREITDDNSA